MMKSGDKVAAVSGDTAPNSILLNQPIVLDNGTSTVKAGFAGGSKPKVMSLSRVGIATIVTLSNRNQYGFVINFYFLLACHRN
jgi:Actin